MQRYTLIRSPGAIALGALFAVGTAYVLFEDVIRGASVSTDHVMTALVLVGTIASGHFFSPALHERRILLAFGCALIFVAGTFICVTGSASRGAEHDQVKRGLVTALQAAQNARSEASAAYAKECASGDGKRCKGAKVVLEAADRHLASFQGHEVADGFGQSAEVFALLTGFPKAAVAETIRLLWPFAKAFMLELATIVFLGLGLGHRELPTVSADKKSNETIETLRKMKRPVTNDELSRIMGVSKGEASKRVKALNGRVQKIRQGRSVAISLVH